MHLSWCKSACNKFGSRFDITMQGSPKENCKAYQVGLWAWYHMGRVGDHINALCFQKSQYRRQGGPLNLRKGPGENASHHEIATADNFIMPTV